MYPELTPIFSYMGRPNEKTIFYIFQFSKDVNGKWWSRSRPAHYSSFDRWKQLENNLEITRETEERITVESKGPIFGSIEAELWPLGEARLPITKHEPHPDENW